jgi:hypothetical protein
MDIRWARFRRLPWLGLAAFSKAHRRSLPVWRPNVAKTGDAAAILRASCKAGRLRFDVEAEVFLRDGAVPEQAFNCDSPDT